MLCGVDDSGFLVTERSWAQTDRKQVGGPRKSTTSLSTKPSMTTLSTKVEPSMKTDTTTDELREHPPGFLKKLFYGYISLPVTFWRYNFLYCVVAPWLALTILASIESVLTSSATSAWLLRGAVVLFLCYFLFVQIATWRSAGRYQKSAFLSGLARFYVIANTLALVVGFAISFGSDGLSDMQLQAAIKSLNEGLPRMGDSETRIENITLQGKDLHYDITLVNVLLTDATDLQINKLEAEMTKDLQNSGCANKFLRGLLNDGRRLIYVYRDKLRKPVAQIVVEKWACG